MVFANGSTAAQLEMSLVIETPLRGPEHATTKPIATAATTAQRTHGRAVMTSVPLP